MNIHTQETIVRLVNGIKAAGFRPFVSAKGDYGFYTDAKGTRVVSFGLDFGSPRFSCNYVTDAPIQCGQGAQIEPRGFIEMFNDWPSWAVRDAKTARYKTLKEYQADYQSSSKFEEVI